MPCVKRLAVRVADQPGTGCRHDCLHRANVEAYREAKTLADEVRALAREDAVAGGRSDGTEGREFDARHPPLLFKHWLQDGRRPREGD